MTCLILNNTRGSIYFLGLPNRSKHTLSECFQTPNHVAGLMSKSSDTSDYKGMAYLQEATAGRGDCNGDSNVSRGSRRNTQQHQVRQSSGIRQHPPRIPEKSGTKSEEIAGNISNPDYLGKEPPQELENYQNSGHP